MIRAGWRDFIKQRFKKPSKYFSIGLEINSQGLHVSVFEMQGGSLAWVKQIALPIENWPQALKRYVEREKLDNTPCHLVYGLDQYSILQVDKPQVEESEVAQALVWSVKDLVPSQDELVVDYFDLPAQSAGANKVNVVAMSKSDVAEMCDHIRSAGLELQSISIAELVMADLVDSSQEAVLTLIQHAGQEMCLSIYKQGQLFFSRRLKGYENLANFSAQELQMGVGDNLSVEIQRSMDYFESQLRQAPVKKILLAVESTQIQTLADILKQLSFMDVAPLTPDVISKIDSDVLSSGFVSLGAAMQQNAHPVKVAS